MFIFSMYQVYRKAKRKVPLLIFFVFCNNCA